MSGNGDGEKPYEVGKGKPPKSGRFPPKTSGNPRGRPVKRKPLLVPNEVRRTVIRVLDEQVEISTPRGPKTVSLFEAIFWRTMMGAAKGNATQLRFAMKLIPDVLMDRIEAHKAVWLADLLQDIEEESPNADPAHRRMLRDQIRHAKDKH